MARELQKLNNGLEYIKGKERVIFSNGVLITVPMFNEFTEKGIVAYKIKELESDPEYSGYDFAYANSTGVIRKKAKHNAGPAKNIFQSTVEKARDAVRTAVTTPKEEKPQRNWFDWAYPKVAIMLILSCSFLSVYFTGEYMQSLQKPVIAYFISACMLLYGLIGTQMCRRAFRVKHYVRAVIFGVTSVCTICFSMYTALDVNFERYAAKHQIVLQAETKHQNNNTEYELIKDELEANKEQIEKLSKTYVVMWDAENKTNRVVDGKITEKAQNSINELTARNQELNNRLIELAKEGTKAENTNAQKALSIPDLLGAVFGVSGNVFQMLILLLPSIFIDLVNVLCVTIYNDRFEKRQEENYERSEEDAGERA